MRRRLGAFAVACALSLLGCAVNPVTGQRELVLVSAEQEAELGRKTAAQFREQLGLVEEPRMLGYVEALGDRLARHSPRQDVRYRFQIADMGVPNAFALPGGYVYVSRGALILANSEAELAGVIGHEIAHVAARHSVQQQTRSVGVGLLTLLGVVAAAAAGGEQAAQTVGQLGQVAGAGLIATYGRDQERQADEVGQRLAANAGYDPAGIAGFLEALGREAKRASNGRSRQPSFLDSHPTTDERVANTLARARTLPVADQPPLTASREAFLRRFEGILVGEDPAGGVFRDTRFLHPVFGFAIDFPRGWQTQNGRSAVLAADPASGWALRLDGGPVGDPADAARDFANQSRIQLQGGERLRIGGLEAYRAQARVAAQGGDVALHLTWIGHRKATFRFTGVAPLADAGAAFRRFDDATGSFRPLTDREFESITERRLRVVAARRGESLAGLSRRTGNVWSVLETAIANGVPESASLASGQPIKIAIERRFQPSR